MDYAGQVVGWPLSNLDAIADLREGLAGVSGHAQIRLQELEALLGQQAERRAAHDYGCAAVLSYAVNDILGNGKRPLCIQVTVIAEIPQRDSNHIRIEVPDSLLDFSQVVLGEHQVNHLDLVPFMIKVARNVSQADWHGLGVHPVVDAVVPVGGD